MKTTLSLLVTTFIIFCSINTTLAAAPPPRFTVTAQSTGPTCTNPCSGSDSAIVTNGIKPYRYHWNTGDTTAAIYNRCAGQYIVVVTDSLGTTATDTNSLSLPPVPPITVTSSGDTIASPDSAYLCATPAYPHYLWSTGDTTQCIYALTEDFYDVTITDSLNCSGVSDELFIYECPVPDIKLVFSGDTLYTFSGDGGCNLSYTLVRNDTQVIVGANVQVLPGPGNYQLVITGDSTCCGGGGNVYTWYGSYTGTGINELGDKRLRLQIYPNPATGTIQLQYGNFRPGNSIEIYNPLGQLVQQQSVKQSGLKQQLDISALPPGIYTIAIKQDNAVVANGKVVKE